MTDGGHRSASPDGAPRSSVSALDLSPSQAPVVLFEKLAPDVNLPRLATEHAVGYDLRAHLTGSRVKLVSGTATPGSSAWVTERGPDVESDALRVWLLPGTRASVPTGLRVTIPRGYAMLLRPCAEAVLMKGLTLIGSSGTDGSDYGEEIRILVRNDTGVEVCIEHGERLASAVFVPAARLP